MGIPGDKLLPDFPVPHIFVSDETFPLLPILMKPFPKPQAGTLPREESLLNFILSSARMVVKITLVFSNGDYLTAGYLWLINMYSVFTTTWWKWNQHSRWIVNLISSFLLLSILHFFALLQNNTRHCRWSARTHTCYFNIMRRVRPKVK